MSTVIGPTVHHHGRSVVNALSVGALTITWAKGTQITMDTKLPDDKVLPFVAPTTGKDKFGNPTTLTGTIKVTSGDPTVLIVTQPDPTTPDNPASGVLTPTGKLGTSQVTFEDDTDAATPLIGLVNVTVVAGATVSLGDPTFGPLRDVPATS